MGKYAAVDDANAARFALDVLDAFAFNGCRHLFWRTDGDYAPISIWANCNDVFEWGSADGEDLTPETLPVFREALREVEGIIGPYGESNAVWLACARIRQTRPQGAAYKYIDERLWPLFDACGEERETGLGNPCKPGQSLGDIEDPGPHAVIVTAP